MIFDAAGFARGWLSAWQAAAVTDAHPALFKTMRVEQYLHGCRLVATDGVILLVTWVPEKDAELTEPEPGFDEIPYASATAFDRHLRGRGLLAHLLSLSRSDDYKGLEIRVQLNVPWQPEENGRERQLDGFEALAVVLEQPDKERVQLEVFEGPYPAWQTVAARTPRSAGDGRVALSAAVMARLAKAAKIHDIPDCPSTTIHCWVAAEEQPVSVAFGSEPEVAGLVMPVRWDFDRDRPFEEGEAE